MLTNGTSKCAKGISLADIHNVELRDIRVAFKGLTGPLLGVLASVTGTGIGGTATLV